MVDGVLTPPVIPSEVGAWTGSAGLDSATGEVTLAGHVNWAGLGAFAFARLADLRPGDVVYTSEPRGPRSTWVVTAVTARPKTAGIDPSAFAGSSGPRTLALITCGGSYDASKHSYDDNVYVTARPAAAG